MPRIQSAWYKWCLSWRHLPWFVVSAGGVWGSWLLMSSGSFVLGLSLLLFSLVLLCSGISVLSTLIRFLLNPSSPATKVTNPLSWGCYLFGYHLSLTLLASFYVAVPARKYAGVVRAKRYSLPEAWILVMLFSIIEELTFRLPLRYSAINLTISALLFTLFPVSSLLLKFGILGSAMTMERWLWRAVFAISVASGVFVLLRIEPVKRLTGSIWSDHFRSVLYLSCFAFGLVHILNFRFTSVTAETLFLVPLLVFPQIIGGFIMAFARMRLGMIWCIVLHVAHNFLLLLLTSGQIRPHS
jgi:hypothetical protein